jgi:glycosyltransferase involved in cell wall biosynthesis
MQWAAMDDLVAFSIIIPTYQRPQEIQSCLAAIARLDYPRELFEVIAVNDGGLQPLTSMVDMFFDRMNITLISQPHAGPAAARNRGASQAKHRYLIFTDDDCRPPADWLRKFNARILPDQSCTIAGRTINALDNNRFSASSQILIDFLNQYYNSDPFKARFFTSNNLMLPIDIFREIGGFDKGFAKAAAEDRDLCDRLIFHNKQVVFAAEITVLHAHALTFLTFFRQHFNYGKGAYDYHKNHTMRHNKNVRMESLSFYSNLVRHPLSDPAAKFKFTTSLLLIVSQIANAAGFFVRSGQRT